MCCLILPVLSLPQLLHPDVDLDFNKLSKHVCLKPQKVEIFKVKQRIGKLNTY